MGPPRKIEGFNICSKSKRSLLQHEKVSHTSSARHPEKKYKSKYIKMSEKFGHKMLQTLGIKHALVRHKTDIHKAYTGDTDWKNTVHNVRGIYSCVAGELLEAPAGCAV